MALTIQGVSTFTINGPPRWGREGWGLDTLTVEYDGVYSALDSFMNARTIWSPSDIDNNLFLERIDNDDDKQYPTVTLHYIGRRNGTRPPARSGTGVSIQSASYHWEGEVNDADASIDVDVQYLAPTSTLTTIDSTANGGGTVGGYAAASVTLIWWNIRSTGDVILSHPLDYFVQSTVSTTQSNELVPGKWYENTQTNTLMLFSVAT